MYEQGSVVCSRGRTKHCSTPEQLPVQDLARRIAQALGFSNTKPHFGECMRMNMMQQPVVVEDGMIYSRATGL